MSKNSYWMTSASGERAYVEGADERDRWIPRGWQAAEAPAEDGTDDTAFVWMEHESDGVTAPALIPWGARDYFQSIGFSPTAPPEPVDLTRDPQVRDQPHPKTAESAKSSAADKPAATTTNTSGKG